MKLRISDLMSVVNDDTVDIAPNEFASASSAERIKEATMRKINNETQDRKQTDMPAKRRHRGAAAALVAAAVLVLATSAFAVVHYLSIDRIEEGESIVYTYGEQELDYSSYGAVITVPLDTEETYYETCFHADYLPVDGNAPELWKDSYEYLLQFHAAAGEGSYDELLGKAGMTADEAKNWNTSISYERFTESGQTDFFRIDLYDGAELASTDYLLDGEPTLVKEDRLGALEATYVSVDLSGTPRGDQIDTMYHIFLYDSGLHTMVDVFGTFGFAELEKIAEGLTLRQTGLEATGNDLGFSVIGGGLG